MRVTHWGEHGIHFAIQIARLEQSGKGPVTAAQLAQHQGIEVAYAQKILQRLRKGAIVKSLRGPAGGFTLDRSAEEITLKDIFIAAEGAGFEVICETHPLHAERCAEGSVCSVKNLWYDMKNHIDGYLNSVTIKKLVDDNVSLEPNPLVQLPSNDSATA